MPVSSDYLAYILEQLARLGPVRAQRMFGAAGLYCEESFFGIVSDDTLYLRVDAGNRDAYTSRGMAPFRPYPGRPEVSMTYYEVPVDVLEDALELVSWSRHSLAAALAAAKRAATPKRAVPQRAARRRLLRRRGARR